MSFSFSFLNRLPPQEDKITADGEICIKDLIKKKREISCLFLEVYKGNVSTCERPPLQYEITCCTLTCLFKLNLLYNTKEPKEKKGYFFLFYYEIVLQCTLHVLLTV